MIGTSLSHYRISAKLGQGGMGEVYRATDTTLGREVAIKLLPEALAADPDRLARFAREAKVLASLNHPGIAQVYGFEAATAASGTMVHFLAMELVEGEELAERLERGPIPVDEALGLARQIAEALEAAHEKGIVHRDLKPANIKITPDGKVKVLDFGLAKAWTGEAAAATATADLSQSPTLARTGTAAGLILGTAAYMSPEQARGKALDKRADIWSFGVVFYEVLTGRRLFEGETVSDILAAVLTREPNWAALPAATPFAARRLLKQCLERNPTNRLHDIADARLTLDEAVAGEPVTGPAGALRRGRVTVALAAFAVGLGLALAALALRWPGSAPDLPVTRFALSADPSVRPDTSYTTPFAVSRDGRTIVFAASAEASTRMYLWVRTLDDPRPRRLEDTEGGGQPALSPDGEWVAFVARDSEIKKVRLRGGAAVSLATIGSLSAALAWASDDEILFELLDAGTGLHRVSAHGGAPEPLVPLDTAAQETMQRRPFVLRAERMVVYASATADGRTGLSMLSLADGRRARLGLEGTRALGVIDGHLVYARHDGRLMAAPLDVRGMRVRGAPVTLPDTVASPVIGPSVALSESGTLVYRGKTATFRLMLVDVAGRTARPLGAEVRPYRWPRFSPDGRFVAVGVGAGGVSGPASPEATSDLWLFDQQSEAATRLTRTGAAAKPEWTPDGKGLVYISGNPPHRREVFTLPLDGSAEPRRLVEIEGDVEHAVMTPDGRGLIAVRKRPGGEGLVDLVRVPLQGGGGPSVLVDPAATFAGRLTGPRVSPDGRFVAFETEANWDVYLRALDGGASLQVTDSEGASPRWGARSGHLYYATTNGWARGEVRTSPTLAVVRRRGLGEFGIQALDYDLSPDEQTLVVVAPDPYDTTVMVALHWGDGVRRTVGGK